METVALNEAGYHDTRLPFDLRREIVWRTLCANYFNRLVRLDFHVLDLGAGYCHFINNIRCNTRTAVDRWEGFIQYLEPTIRGHVGTVTDLGFLKDRSVDFVFASNLFEHLTREEFSIALQQIRQKLKGNGSLNILQPNYRFAYREYFDDYTHVSVYSDVSLCDFLTANGFRILETIPGFLPFSIKSCRVPVRPWLIGLYLRSPWKPFAKQMFIRAEPL